MKNSENQRAETMKQTDGSRQNSGGVQSGSRFSTMSMVQVAIFGAIICIMAFTPFLGYIPLGFTSGTEKGSGAGIPFRADQFYQ